MRFALPALAATALLTSPALAGGDWDYGDDRYGEYGAYDGYYVGPAEYYAGFYPPRWAAPRYYVPGPAYAPPPPYGYAARGYQRFDDGECEIKRKWRRGRYVEKIDCDD